MSSHPLLSPALAAKELGKRVRRKEMTLDPRFIAQNKFVEDTNRYLAVQCGRRSGKTNGLALRLLRSMEKHPKSQCLYLAMTRESAFSIMWPVLIEFNDKYNLGCVFTESTLTMKHPNGSKLRLLGADMKNFVKRLRGIKAPGIALDEAQDFGVHLQSLVDDVLTPCISDYVDGWLALTGTPGPVPQGYFFDITQGRKFGFSFHDWTILDNPFMPDAAGFIADLIKRREWDDNHPTLLREWRNQWVLDVQSLWVQYHESVNHYTELPPGKYTYLMGVDLGFKDADAIAVIAWTESSPVTYLVEEYVMAKQGITELANEIKRLAAKYDVAKMVIDEGGLGKKAAEEMRRQHHIPLHAADKIRKQENVDFLNDALRLGRFKAKAKSRFAQDSYLVQIDWEKSTPSKIVVKKHPHSDIIDAVLYAFKESPAYTYAPPPVKPKPGTDAWFAAQEDEIEERLLSMAENSQKDESWEDWV